MSPQNELALVIAYYLSRSDKDAVTNLGYTTFREAIVDIGNTLGVKPNTVKNMRDEFDYHMHNSRIGWRRELRGSRLKVFRTFQMTDDNELLEISKEILTNKNWVDTDNFKDLQSVLSSSEKKSSSPGVFVLRGPTGKKAEQHFMDAFSTKPFPEAGQLIDCRDLGCGYDYEIKAADGVSYYVEIKGLASSEGGILLTDKEWRTAKKYKDRYYIVIISDISNDPQLKTIQNPAEKLVPKRNVYTTVQIGWTVSSKALRPL